MTLLLQVLGILAAAGLLAAGFKGRVSRPTFAAAAGLVVAAIAAALALSAFWPTARNLVKDRRENARLGAQQAADLGGAEQHVNTAFVDWVRARLRGRESYALILPPTAGSGSAGYQWTTYRLLPHILSDPGKANVLVFYQLDPAAAAYDRARFAPPETFSPGNAIARRLGAG